MEVALTYKTLREFREQQAYLYGKASRNGWLPALTAHMERENRGAKRKYTKAQLAKVAKGYRTRGDFKSNDNTAYVIAHREGWLDDICKHMISGYERRRIEKAKEKKKE